MSTSLETRAPGHERYDLHNVNIDETAAIANLCGVLDLRNGRVCRLPALHPRGCRFECSKGATLRPPNGGAGASDGQ